MLSIIKKTLLLLSQKEKRNLALLSFFMFLNALFEVFGIASVAPLIAVITNPDSLSTIPMLNEIYERYQFQDHQHFSFVLSLAILFIILLSNAMILMTHYLSMRYANGRQHAIGTRLLKTYLYQSYSFFLERHSTELLRNIFNEVAFVMSNVITQLLYLLSRAISIISIVVFIFIINPKVTLIMCGILGGAYMIVYFFLKKRLYRLGKKNVAMTQEKLQSITDSIKVIRDIKMLRAEKIFLERFDVAAHNYSKIKTQTDIYGLAPRYIIEVFAIFALVSAIIYMISTYENSDEMLPILGIYAFAGYKLLPAMQQMFNSLSKIQFSAHSLDIISKELDTLKETAEYNMKLNADKIPFNKSIAFKDVSFHYSNEETVLDNINFEIQKNQKIGIIGESGSGKSTLIDLIVGLSQPKSGKFLIDGKKLDSKDYVGWRQNISYVSQNVYLLDDRVDMNIALARHQEEVDSQRAEQASKLALVDDFLREGDNDLSFVTGENGIRLSGGQRQRIGIARALYQESDILVLDEATSALDIHTENKILENIINEKERTIILITHRVETLKFCDKIYVISEGKIVDQGTYKKLEKKSAQFKKLSKSNVT